MNKKDLNKLENSGRTIVLAGEASAGVKTALKSFAPPEYINVLSDLQSAINIETMIYANVGENCCVTGEVRMCSLSESEISGILRSMLVYAARSCKRDGHEEAYINALKKELERQKNTAPNGSPAYNLKDEYTGRLVEKAAELELSRLMFLYDRACSGVENDPEAAEERFGELLKQEEQIVEGFCEIYREFYNKRVDGCKWAIENFGGDVEELPKVNAEDGLRGYKFALDITDKVGKRYETVKYLKKYADLLSKIKCICRFDSKFVNGLNSLDLDYFTKSFIDSENQEVRVLRFAEACGGVHGSDIKQDMEDALSGEQSNQLIYFQDMNRLSELRDPDHPFYRFCLTSKKDVNVIIIPTHLDEYIYRIVSRPADLISGTGNAPSKEEMQKCLDEAHRETEKLRDYFNEQIKSYNRSKTKPRIAVVFFNFGTGLMTSSDICEVLKLKGYTYPKVLMGAVSHVGGLERNNLAYSDISDRFRVSEDFAEKVCALDTSKCSGSYTIKEAYNNLITFVDARMDGYGIINEACYRKWVKFGQAHEAKDKSVNSNFIKYLRNFFSNFSDKFTIDLSYMVTEGMTDEEKARTEAALNKSVISHLCHSLGTSAVILLGEEANFYTNDMKFSRAMAAYIHENYFRSSTIQMDDKLVKLINEAAANAMAEFVRKYCVIV